MKPSNESTTTLNAPPTPSAASEATVEPISSSNDLLKPTEPRRSHDEKSVADSEASYDIVSGATSRAPGSPKEEKKGSSKEEESDDDWE